jgi:NTE family protein
MELDALRNPSILKATVSGLSKFRSGTFNASSPHTPQHRLPRPASAQLTSVALRWMSACVALACAALSVVALAQPAPMPAAQPEAQTAAAPAAGRKRPKIGLVLSGGGARGITHVGVIKVLEEMNVPVDYIAATSMGSIVGGLYAIDKTPAEMERIVTSISWTSMFSDAPPRKDVTFREKQRDDRFPLPLEIGFRDGEIRGFQGALTGTNLEIFLHELTSSADGVRSFDALPIPFRCVATNMVTGKPYVFDSGPLYQAMRSSMSIPGIFSPAEYGGQILGDGGLVDNLPIDIVRAMGADIVIAVNIGTPLADRSQLTSIIGITGQMINILTEQNVRAQLATLRPGDILISPDLGSLSASDFTQAAEFIRRGEAVAREMAPRLAELSLSPAAYALYKREHPRIAEAPAPKVDFVRIEGTQYANPLVIRDELDVHVDKPLDIAAVNRGLERLYGTGDYERINYRMVEEGDRAGLIVDVQEKSMGPTYVRFGLNYITDFQGETGFSLLAGAKRTWVNSLGAQWLNELELGRISRIATEFYQPFNVEQDVFGSAYASAQGVPRYVFSGDQRVAEYRVETNTVGLDLGIPVQRQGELRAGLVYTYYKGSPTIAIPAFYTLRQTDAGGRLLARWDNRDTPFFPQRGAEVVLDAFYGTETQRLGDAPEQTYGNLARTTLYANVAVPIDANDFLNVAVRGGALSRDVPSIVNPYLLGGFLNLSGLRYQQLEGSYLAFGRVVYYHNLGRVPYIGGNTYVGGSLEAGNTWQTRGEASASDLITAGSLFLGADTFLGPFYFAYGRASTGASSFYILLGKP